MVMHILFYTKLQHFNASSALKFDERSIYGNILAGFFRATG